MTRNGVHGLKVTSIITFSDLNKKYIEHNYHKSGYLICTEGVVEIMNNMKSFMEVRIL